jgi:hydroxymethylpyrimidine/phosphomethylpyrimidine kinase
MISKHGAPLLHEEAQQTLARELLPHATLVTPNLYEASMLSGRQIKDPSSMESAAKDIAELGPRAVLIKGDHLSGEATDMLYADGLFHLFSAPRSETAHTHGMGLLDRSITMPRSDAGRGENLPAQVMMTGILSLIVFMGLLVIVSIDHPFTGPVHVGAVPLQTAVEDFYHA